MHILKLLLLCILVALARTENAIKQKCPEVEIDGHLWPSKSVGESVLYYCNGTGYYRRICLGKKTPTGVMAHWSRLVNMCSMFIGLLNNVECKGDETWKETPAGQYAYIPCPGSYKGYIGRFCTETGEWGHTKDFCYLPDGRKEEEEFEVEL